MTECSADRGRCLFSSPAPINPAEWGSYQADLRPRLAPAQQQALAQLTSQPRLRLISLLAALNHRAARDLAPDRELDGWMDRYISLQLPGLRCNPASPPTAQPVHGFGFWAARMWGASSMSSGPASTRAPCWRATRRRS